MQGFYATAWRDSYLISQCSDGENKRSVREGAGSGIHGAAAPKPQGPLPSSPVPGSSEPRPASPWSSRLHLKSTSEPRPAETEERSTGKIINPTKTTKFGHAERPLEQGVQGSL